MVVVAIFPCTSISAMRQVLARRGISYSPVCTRPPWARTATLNARAESTNPDAAKLDATFETLSPAFT